MATSKVRLRRREQLEGMVESIEFDANTDVQVPFVILARGDGRFELEQWILDEDEFLTGEQRIVATGSLEELLGRVIGDARSSLSASGLSSDEAIELLSDEPYLSLLLQAAPIVDSKDWEGIGFDLNGVAICSQAGKLTRAD